MIRVEEKQLIGKRPDQRLCEDGIFVGEHFAAVVDGVTSKGVRRWRDGLSGGGLAKEIVLETLAAMPADVSCETFFDKLDKALRDACGDIISENEPQERPRACVAAYSRYHREIWLLGDCAFMVNGRLFTNGKPIDDILSGLRAMVIEEALKKGMTEQEIAANDVGRAAIAPFFRTQFSFENDPRSYFGYGVLNGQGVAHDLIIRHAVAPGDTVVLASDGYPVLCDTLAESEARLAELLAKDPLCFRANRTSKGVLPGNRSFDDRAYLKFVVE